MNKSLITPCKQRITCWDPWKNTAKYICALTNQECHNLTYSYLCREEQVYDHYCPHAYKTKLWTWCARDWDRNEDKDCDHPDDPENCEYNVKGIEKEEI